MGWCFSERKIDKDKVVWTYFVLIDKSSKLKSHCLHKSNKAFQEMNRMWTMKHMTGSIMVWKCFAQARLDQFIITESVLIFLFITGYLKKIWDHIFHRKSSSTVSWKPTKDSFRIKAWKVLNSHTQILSSLRKWAAVHAGNPS